MPEDLDAPANEPQTPEALQKEVLELGPQLMREFPESTGPLVLMAKLHDQFGDREEAVRWWQKVRDRSLRRPDADYHRAAAAYSSMGVIAAARGDFQEAAELLDKARQIDPDQPGVHQRLGQALLQLGRPDEAVGALEEQIRRQPEAKTPYRGLGQAYLELQQFEKAAASFEKGLERSRNDPRAYYGLATAYTRLGQKERARECWERFRQLQAASDRSIRIEREEYTKLDWMCRAVAPMHVYAAGVYFKHGRPREGEQQLKRAAELDVNDQTSRQRLVDFYMRQRRYAKALPFCQQLRKIAPHIATYHRNAGVALAGLRRFDESEEALRKGIELEPTSPDGYNSLVQVLLVGTHKYADSETFAEKLVQIQPTAANYYLLFLACRANQNLQGARAAIDRAYRLSPTDRRIRQAHQQLQENHE